jgi:hypothetical protein
MPPKKRALEQVDAGVQSKRAAKQQKRDEPEKGTEKQKQTDAEPNPGAEVCSMFDTKHSISF